MLQEYQIWIHESSEKKNYMNIYLNQFWQKNMFCLDSDLGSSLCSLESGKSVQPKSDLMIIKLQKKKNVSYTYLVLN